MERRIFNHGDIGHGSAARHRAFQQIMAQHLLLGQPARQHGMHRLHVEKAFAGECTFSEHVLVNLGGRRAVRINAALPGKQPVEHRRVFEGWQGRHHPGLQDAITAHNAPLLPIRG